MNIGMNKGWTGVVIVLALTCLVLGAQLGLRQQRSAWRDSTVSNPIERGRVVAERMGCFGCHGPAGSKPIPNPGAAYSEVPAWDDGTWMIWNNRVADARAWIEDGHPPTRAADVGALIPMPAYGDLLTEAELDDVLAYYLAVAQFGFIEDEQVKRGRSTAAQLGCFGCHGPEGRGLIWNPGSLKGYIPGWEGSDYDELVRDDDEFRQWVRNGISDRANGNPVARQFLQSQTIQMPAYGEHVTDEQLDSMLAYVKWVRENPRGATRLP